MLQSTAMWLWPLSWPSINFVDLHKFYDIEKQRNDVHIRLP